MRSTPDATSIATCRLTISSTSSGVRDAIAASSAASSSGRLPTMPMRMRLPYAGTSPAILRLNQPSVLIVCATMVRARRVSSASRCSTMPRASASEATGRIRNPGKSRPTCSMIEVAVGSAIIVPAGRSARLAMSGCSARVMMTLRSKKYGRVKLSQPARSGVSLRKERASHLPVRASDRLSSQLALWTMLRRRPARAAISRVRSAAMPRWRPCSSSHS